MAQANDGTSLQTQLQLGQRRARQLKFRIHHWQEGGKSSDHEDITKRPYLFALYEQIKQGRVKHLWVYDQSRISRKDAVASAFRLECARNGVRLYTKDGEFDLANPQDRFVKLILDGLGEFENSIRSERTRIGKLNRAKEGNWFGGPPPFGYQIVDKKLTIEKKEAAWVKRIFTESLKGASTLEIKHLLDSKGVLPRRKKGTWSIGSISALIKNTHYKGTYSYHDKKSNEIVDLSCPAIVDEKSWTAVQALKTRKTSRVSQTNRTKQFYLLRDLMFCGHCGRPMAGRYKAAKNERLYYCPNKERDWVNNGGAKTPWKRGENCGMSRSLNIPETDKLVWDTVVETHKKSAILREQVKWQILEESNAPLRRNEADIKSLERQHKQMQRLLLQKKDAQANVLVALTDDKVKKDVYELALEKMRDEVHNLEVKIANVQLQITGDTQNKKWVDWLKIYGESLKAKEMLSDEEKKQYIRGLVEKITVTYDFDRNEHKLTLRFELPIVADGVTWNDAENRKAGYKVKRGRRTTTVGLKKKDPRWAVKSVPMTP